MPPFGAEALIDQARQEHMRVMKQPEQLPFGRRFSRLAVLAVVALAIAGCSSSGPRVSGFAIGDTRIVSLNEVIEIRMPLREDGSRQWRVTSFDSFFISLIDTPRPVPGRDGKPELLVRARARTPGETTLEITEVGAAKPRVRRFTIRINQ
ncbi:MAG: hypothetical protein ACYTGC_17325 [Planctomycetota bacterium]|jgi:hypothetical protein